MQSSSLHELISSPKSAIWRQLNNFREIVEKHEIWQPTEDIQFVFLCGANISPGTPSKRRQVLLDFSDKNLPHAKFFLAESMFKILQAEGHKTNLLDIENEVSAFADFIIVVLESESAFCELGAFATHPELRKKIIVINNSNHKQSESFINLGPVKAINEISNGSHILYYKMEENGKINGDAIGDIFKELYDIIHKKPKTRRTRVEKHNPNENFTKESLRFIHDLIYFSSPVSVPELSRILKIIFYTSNETMLKKHIAILYATKQIKRTKTNLYMCIQNKAFFEYEKYDINKVIAAFKNMYFRYATHRLT